MEYHEITFHFRMDISFCLGIEACGYEKIKDTSSALTPQYLRWCRELRAYSKTMKIEIVDAQEIVNGAFHLVEGKTLSFQHNILVKANFRNKQLSKELLA